jgi:uncharacterized radical SAM superfamily Fe-S cluster-containing enzyme
MSGEKEDEEKKQTEESQRMKTTHKTTGLSRNPRDQPKKAVKKVSVFQIVKSIFLHFSSF